MVIITVDIVEAFINSISFEQEVIDSAITTGKTELCVENVYHAKKGRSIKIDSGSGFVSYVIDSVDYVANKVTVIGEIVGPEKTDLDTPSFFHGDPLETNRHITKAVSEIDLPFIYLLGNGMQNGTNRREELFKRTLNLDLFFVDDSSVPANNTEHFENILRPLYNLQDKFNEDLKKYSKFDGYNTDFSIKPIIKWGEVRNLSGNIKAIFDAELDALGYSVKVPLNTNCLC